MSAHYTLPEQLLQEELEDTKGVIRSYKSKIPKG